MDGDSSTHNKRGSILQDQNLEPMSVPLDDLKRITKNFSYVRLLGEGGFSKVYKGVLENGSMIAVKKLTSAIEKRHFENEAHHLMGLNHPNIVKLVGYCSETETIPTMYHGKIVNAERSENLLCLEYLPNGCLRSHLSDESTGLDWDIRYKIIKGICNGLHYLHEEWLTPIIHMDLKPENILLDDNMVPKIADFGLSRLFGTEKTRTVTISPKGTFGYMAQEYINRGIITKQLDIFSLGVIIIEIVTGGRDYPDEGETLPLEYMKPILNNWRHRMDEAPRELECYQIKRCIEIALDCVKPERTKRPTIGKIIEMLPGEEPSFDIDIQLDSGTEIQHESPDANCITGSVTLQCPATAENEIIGSIELNHGTLTLDQGSYTMPFTNYDSQCAPPFSLNMQVSGLPTQNSFRESDIQEMLNDWEQSQLWENFFVDGIAQFSAPNVSNSPADVGCSSTRLVYSLDQMGHAYEVYAKGLQEQGSCLSSNTGFSEDNRSNEL